MEKQYLDSIVELTRAREPEVLSENLLASLVEHLPIRSISRVDLFDAKNLQKCEQTVKLTLTDAEKNWDLQPKRFRIQEQIADRFPEGRCFSVPTDCGFNTYIPILKGDEPSSFIKLDGKEDFADQKDLVNIIVEVYSNILQVLEDGQRDKLTGLLNRRTFDSKLFRMMELQKKAAAAFAKEEDRREASKSKFAWLAIADIDHFKRVNDTYGHITGDEVILTVAERMKQTFRSTDLLFRFGGEEFVIVLEPVPETNATIALERFREAIESYEFPQIGKVTVSVGFAALEEKEYAPEVLDRADQALYFSKENGRNRVANYETLVEFGQIEAMQMAKG